VPIQPSSRRRATIAAFLAAATVVPTSALAAGSDPFADARVIYVSNETGNYDIFSIKVDGSDKRQLTSSSDDEFDPAGSPDGTHVAFVRNSGGNRDIWTMDTNGGHQTRLTTSSASDRYPAWSADGTQIAFRSNRRPSTSLDIWRMKANGKTPVRVTADARRWGDSIETTPSWAPNGKRIAFVSDRDGNKEIYSAGINGGTPRRLTNNAVDDYSPAWSPTGGQIAFVSERTGNNEIFVMRAKDGAGETNLTNDPGSDRYPAWSPNGRKIVFRSNRDKRADLFLMDPDGSGVARLMKALGHQIEPGFQGFGFVPVKPPVPRPTPTPAPPRLELRVMARPRQHVVRHRGVRVYVRCSLACRIVGRGHVTVRVKGVKRVIGLRTSTRQIVAGTRTRVRLKLTGRRLRHVARLLKQGKHPRAHLTVAVPGVLGARTKLTVRVRR
jgi:dipeptidyl aminopeptidase/acylaminoacyl peptidase